MLLMVEKGIRGGICNAVHQYTKDNNKYMKDYDKNNKYMKDYDKNDKYMKDYDKNKEPSYLNH